MSISNSDPPRPRRERGSDSGPGAKRPPLSVAGEPDGSVVHQINDVRFVQRPTALHTWAPPADDDKPPKTYQILRGVLDVAEVRQLRDLTASREPETLLTDTLFITSYQPDPSRPDPANRAEVSAIDRDSRDPQWPDHLGIRPRAIKRQIPKIAEALTAMAATAERDGRLSDAYACAGPLRLPDGGYAFLRPGKAALTAAGPDAALTCYYPDGIGGNDGVKPLDIDDPSNAETAAADLAALLRILDLTPGQPEIAHALAFLLAWAPFAAVPDMGRAVALLAGDTGARKTAAAGVLIAAQSSTFAGGIGIPDPVTVKMRHNQSTVYGTDKVLHPLSGLLAIADDLFADQMSPRELAETWRRLSAIADNAATGTGGTRGGYRNGRGIVAATAYPRCSVLYTAERLPDEERHSSATARLAVLKLDSPVSLPVLTECQGNARALSRAHAAMIVASLPDLARQNAALAWGKEEARAWGIDGHSRALYGYARLLAGAHLLGTRIAEVLGADPAAFVKDASDLLRKAASDQARRSGMRGGRDISRDPVRLFARYLREALAGSPLWLAAPEVSGQDFRPPRIPGHGAQAVGWRQTSGQLGTHVPGPSGPPCGAVHVHEPGQGGRPPWRPVTARIRAADWPRVHDAVARLIMAETGWSLPAIDELRQALADAGYLRSAESMCQDLWGTRPKCLALDLGRVLDGSDGQADDEPGESAKPEPGPDPGGPESAQETLGPFPSPAPAARGVDPDPERSGALKPCPGPCRGCGETWQYGKGGWLCPACRTAPSEPEPEQPAGRTGGASRAPAHMFAVLGTDGLHVPRASEPEPCELPASLADAYALASGRGIRQLWIDPAAAVALGLPDFRTLPDAPIGSGYAHPWAALPASLKADPDGLSAWATIWEPAAGRSASGLSVVLPHLESRAPWAYDDDGALWGDRLGPAGLLEAVTLLAGALGQDYYRSPNATTSQLARHVCAHREPGPSGNGRQGLIPCRAVNAGKLPPVITAGPDGRPRALHRLMIPPNWERELTAAESGRAGLLRVDRNAAYLSGMSTPLGIGEPEHKTGPVAFDKRLAGYYRLASQPGGSDPMLPPLEVSPADDGGLWVTRPDAELLAGLGRLPEISEAWVWPQSARALDPLYNRLRKARAALHPVKGTPAGRVAWGALGCMFHSFTGYLARTRGPSGPDDLLWRPDYRDHLEAESYARMFRNLAACGQASGRYPVATHVDAAWFAVDGPEDFPTGLTYDGLRGGAWKPEGYAPLSALDLAELQASFDDALNGGNDDA